jgi:SAM-dependent methyltransferase
MSTQRYTPGFFAAHRAGSQASARRILPIICDWVDPASIVDVGCGTGEWLGVASALGIERLTGIDGAHLDDTSPTVPVEAFRQWDLTRPLDRSFASHDLAICLEVAEHLPAEAADTLVDSLSRLAPVVLFSAAIPHQTGTGHVNEQWPAYWAERFARQGFLPFDVIRSRIWDDSSVEWWYRQNLMLYIRDTWIHDRPALAERLGAPGEPRALVHPECFLAANDRLRSRRSLLAALVRQTLDRLMTRPLGRADR